ncbi:unnamed protein product, partial [Linum tenue]
FFPRNKRGKSFPSIVSPWNQTRSQPKIRHWSIGQPPNRCRPKIKGLLNLLLPSPCRPQNISQQP